MRQNNHNKNQNPNRSGQNPEQQEQRENWFQKLQQDLGYIKYLEQSGSDPMRYVQAQMCDAEGFDLPQMEQHQLFLEALYIQTLGYEPPPVSENDGLFFGEQL